MAFVATNLDDLFLLVAWFAAGRYRTRDIVLGQYAGIGSLFAASVAASLVSRVLSAHWLPWLGLVPLALGVALLVRPGKEPQDAPAGGASAIAAVTIANGADNLGVYIPLFATSSAQALAVMGATFAVMTALWCLAAQRLVQHPEGGATLRRYGPPLVPYVLMGIGLWILLR